MKLEDAHEEMVTSDEVRQFLAGQDAYKLHKPAHINLKKNKVFVPRPLNQPRPQALAQHNVGYNYLLTVIDVFSKMAFVCCLKRKTAGDLVQAFKSIFKKSRTPEKL